MPKIRGAREKRHQPFWDSLIRGTVGNFTFASGSNALAATNNLFQTASGGNISITNMEGAGAMPSDQTYRVLALRCGLYFRGCTGTSGGTTLTDHVMYHRAESQLFWELFIAQKSAFQAYTPYLPQGGGLFGDVGSDTTVYFVNGHPGHDSTMVLARSIAIPARQNFRVVNTIAALGAANFLTDVGNLTAGEVWIWYTMDGLHVRDIL
jgi:hypothetical protein